MKDHIKLFIRVILLSVTVISASFLWAMENGEYPGLPEVDIPGPEQVICYTGFTLLYRDDWKQARWVAYELTAEEVMGEVKRTDNFRSDPDLMPNTARLKDYRKSGYDRGHLCPAADQVWSVEAMSDSFYLTNMSPQVPRFNRGVWSRLESAFRTFAAENDKILIVTGPLVSESPGTIGPNEIAVPEAYFKIAMDLTGPEKKGIGFILPNEGSTEELETFAVTIDMVEDAAGINFFPLLSEEEEMTLESDFNTELWPFIRFNKNRYKQTGEE